MSYLPGGLATGSVSYHAVFHDLPDCLETHVYAPLGLDIRGKWSVGGSLPGEPKQHTDDGLKVPRIGLYIREEVKMTCSKLLLRFVKKTFKDSHSRLVEKLVERAHILESNFANERLKALRNVEPRERMGHGDIFIAPPPDYQFAPPPYRPQAPSLFSSHSRSQSASQILTHGLLRSSLTERNASVLSLSTHQDRPSSSRSVSHTKAASVPDHSLYLLPATTYDGGLSTSFNRPISLYPGSTSYPPLDRVVSFYYETTIDDVDPDEKMDEEPETVSTHVVSPPYIPEVRPISFNFAFDPKSPRPRTSIFDSDLLADIDAAIDDSYTYLSPDTPYDDLLAPDALHTASQIDTLPVMTYQLLPSTIYSPSSITSIDILPSTTYTAAPIQIPDTLPSTTYSPGALLSSVTYEPKKERKDSVMPYYTYSELPPVPPKDEKYRRPSQIAT